MQPPAQEGEEGDLSFLEHIFPDQFTREYPVWSKTVVLRALDNPTVMYINTLVKDVPPENQMQAITAYTVAASLVSVNGKVLPTKTPLEQRVVPISKWDDVLLAALMHRCTELAAEYRSIIEGVTDPNSSGPPAPTTSRSRKRRGSPEGPSTTSASPS